MSLSWRVQNIVVIGRVYSKLERSEFSSNFEFDRNMLSGTGARTPVATVLMTHPCISSRLWVNAIPVWMSSLRKRSPILKNVTAENMTMFPLSILSIIYIPFVHFRWNCWYIGWTQDRSHDWGECTWFTDRANSQSLRRRRGKWPRLIIWATKIWMWTYRTEIYRHWYKVYRCDAPLFGL